MLPGRFSLQLYRGDSASYQFLIWTDRQGMTPLNIAGAVALAEIRDKPGGILLTTMSTIISAPNIIKVSLTPGQTAVLPHNGVWDLQISFGTGEVITPIGGGVSVQDDVTGNVIPLDPNTGQPIPLPPDPVPEIDPRDVPRSYPTEPTPYIPPPPGL